VLTIGGQAQPTLSCSTRTWKLSIASDAAAITFLNVNAASVNVFWQRDSLEILPGRYAVPI
jgi:hypothetical protein